MSQVVHTPPEKGLKQQDRHYEEQAPSDVGKLNEFGHPTYLGSSGNKLTWMITVRSVILNTE